MHNTSKALSTVCLLHMQYQKKMGQGMCVFFLVMLQVRQKYFTSSFFYVRTVKETRSYYFPRGVFDAFVIIKFIFQTSGFFSIPNNSFLLLMLY